MEPSPRRRLAWAVLAASLGSAPAFAEISGLPPFAPALREELADGFDAVRARGSAPRSARPLDELLEELRSSPELERQLAALAELDVRFFADFAEEFRAAQGIRFFIETPSKPAAARARAVKTLGEVASHLRSSAAIDEAAEFLASAAAAENPVDPLSSLRLNALHAITRFAGRIPFASRRAQMAVVGAAFQAVERRSLHVQDRLFGMMIVHSYLRGHGLGILLYELALRDRLDQLFLRPYQGSIEPLYADAQNTTDVRYVFIITLDLLRRLRDVEPDVRFRAGRILASMRDREPDPRLRELLRWRGAGAAHGHPLAPY